MSTRNLKYLLCIPLQTEISEDGETAKLKQGTSKDEDDSMQPIQQVFAHIFFKKLILRNCYLMLLRTQEFFVHVFFIRN